MASCWPARRRGWPCSQSGSTKTAASAAMPPTASRAVSCAEGVRVRWLLVVCVALGRASGWRVGEARELVLRCGKLSLPAACSAVAVVTRAGVRTAGGAELRRGTPVACRRCAFELGAGSRRAAAREGRAVGAGDAIGGMASASGVSHSIPGCSVSISIADVPAGAFGCAKRRACARRLPGQSGPRREAGHGSILRFPH